MFVFDLSHGDIKGTKPVHHNSCFNLIVEYLDRSSATRAVRSQNLLRGNILKVDYCDSSGNPWVSSTSHRTPPIGSTQNQRSDRKLETMLVDRAGPSSATQSHHHHHHHHHPHQAQQPQQQQQQQQRQMPPQQLRFQSATSPSSSSRQGGLHGAVGSASLKVVFTPPPKYAEMQIKQALCDELHKFVKSYHVNLLPAAATGGRQTRVALVMFRRTEDEEKALLAFRNAGRCLFGAPVHVELCSGTGTFSILANCLMPCNHLLVSTQVDGINILKGFSLVIPPHLLADSASSIPIHSSNSSPPSLAVPRTTRPPASSLPTRSLIVHGLTAGPNGPVSEIQLNTAFQRFGAILHVQMRPTSNSAIIEFVELRGSTRAMTTHQRDPLRLGGRPLRLFYTPSRPVSCLFINDIPASLVHHSEGELKTLFSRVVPIAQVSKITRSQESSANTTVHTCALLELASQELATQLLEYLRSPESPLVLATQNRSPESFTAPRLPTFVCSVDFASPKQMGRVMTFAKVVETVRLRPSGMTTRAPPPPPSFDVATEKSRSSAPRPSLGNHRPREQVHNSSEEEYSRSSSTSNSSLCKRFTDSNAAPPLPSTPAATFPSQRWGVAEAPLFISQKRYSDPLRGEPNRSLGTAATNTVSQNLSEDVHVCESMYDKIKRRTEGEKERRKRPTLESEESEESRLMRRKRRRKQHYQPAPECGLDDDSENEGDYEGSGEDLVEEANSLREGHKLKCSNSSSRHRSHSHSSKNLPTSSSRFSVESHRHKSWTTQVPSKAASTTITRLSLGMSVPVTASYHTISKTPSSRGEQQLSRLSSASGESRSGSVTSENTDIKPTSNRRSSEKRIKSSSLLESRSTTGLSVSRSHSLNDVDSASGCSARPLAQKRIKRRDCVKPPSSLKTEKRQIPIQPVFRPSRVASPSFSTDNEREEKDQSCNSRLSKWSNNAKVCLLNHNSSSKAQKSRTTSKAKAKTRKTHSSSRVSDSSSSSVSSFGSSRRRCSVDVEGVNASTPLSCGSHLAKPTPPSRPSDFHPGLSEADDGYSLDDFDRFSANTAMTPSTEAMEISPETGDEEADHPVSEWFTRMSSNHSESEVEPDRDQAGEEEEDNGDSRNSDQKPLLINFDDINILNTSKEDSLNLSNRDAIGDIGMDDQPSPRLNESSDKSVSRSLVEEPTETVKPPSDEVVSPPIATIFKPQPPPTPPKLDSGTLPPPPPPPPNVQQILSPYSSSSPTQSLCSACSRSSPSPIVTAPVQTSRAGAATNVVTETTNCMRTTVSVPQDTICVKPLEKPTPLSENRDLKRYVQSVIERVKAETVDDATTHRSVASITPITSPLYHPPTASPPTPPLPPPPTPTSLSQASRKGVSSATSRRTSGATPPGLMSSASSPNARSTTAKMLFESSGIGLLSIPGVNACAPLSDPPSASPRKLIPEVIVEPKTLRSTSRRRAKMAAVAAASGPPVPTPGITSTFAMDLATAVPKQPTDPYEPNFDEDSPPLAKLTVNATSPLVVNTSLASEHPGTASAVSSVTTTEEAVSTNDTLKSNTIRRSALDTVDEIIADVCCGRFDMKSYLDSWGLQPPPPCSRSGLSSVTTAASLPVTTAAAATTTVKTTDTKPPVVSAPTNNPIFTAIINALQSITGSSVVIGGSTNNGSSGLRQGNPGTGQQLPQKTSTVVVGSSPPTISATTITFPVFFKNVFSAANNSMKNASGVAAASSCSIKTTVANSHPVTMTTASSNVSQQQLLHQQDASTVAVPRPQSSTTDNIIENPHPYRVQRGTDNNGPVPGLIDDSIPPSGLTGQPQQRQIFNPRSFTSPPPRYPPFSSPRHVPPAPQPPPPPPHLSHTPTPWSASSMSAYPRPTPQESSPVAPTQSTNTFSPAAVLEKLSCFIDPDLVLPMLQAALQEGQHLDPDLLASLAKMFQQYSAGGGDGGGIPPPPNTANSTPSPSQTSAGGGGGGGSGQYHHLPRAGGASTPPVSRTGSFDQVRLV
ncbi:unnamed protein product [Hydatigera taeniaeformis]|uniref:RRM domain-containing protein n=1 Tax=Hydatigena taeniaeformis TaxID=6205 RepID=A0A3P7ENA9_HYDTA|nr:unnamed protein product [Hydatigera taeniaeformis]